MPFSIACIHVFCKHNLSVVIVEMKMDLSFFIFLFQKISILLMLNNYVHESNPFKFTIGTVFKIISSHFCTDFITQTMKSEDIYKEVMKQTIVHQTVHFSVFYQICDCKRR